jgi:hypothetical protein
MSGFGHADMTAAQQRQNLSGLAQQTVNSPPTTGVCRRLDDAAQSLDLCHQALDVIETALQGGGGPVGPKPSPPTAGIHGRAGELATGAAALVARLHRIGELLSQ